VLPWDVLDVIDAQNGLEERIIGDVGALLCYWEKSKGQKWRDELELSSPERTVPVMWHVDGYKVYRRKKAWAWSWPSATVKTGSLKSKIVLTAVYLNRLNTV
jgi:hypothetical protein